MKKNNYWIDFGLTKVLVLENIFLTALKFWIYRRFQKFPKSFLNFHLKGKAK